MDAPANRFVRLLRARPWLFIAAAVAVAVWAALPVEFVGHAVTRLLIAWNAGTCLYVLLSTVMMIRSSDRHIRERAQLQDDGQIVILVLVVIATVASLAAIAGQLSVAKGLDGKERAAHVALAAVTVVSSWAFIQVMFALHYAHDYYAALMDSRPPGLRFPQDEHPTYGDFFYFAAVIGTSGQTADVSIVTKPMRRVGAVHCILAYVFNTTVLALLVNIGAGMF